MKIEQIFIAVKLPLRQRSSAHRSDHFINARILEFQAWVSKNNYFIFLSTMNSLTRLSSAKVRNYWKGSRAWRRRWKRYPRNRIYRAIPNWMTPSQPTNSLACSRTLTSSNTSWNLRKMKEWINLIGEFTDTLCLVWTLKERRRTLLKLLQAIRRERFVLT